MLLLLFVGCLGGGRLDFSQSLTARVGVGEVVNDYCAVDAGEADAVARFSECDPIDREVSCQLTILPT